MKSFNPDESTQITYDEEAGAFYVKTKRDRIFPAIVPSTETLCESPLINIDRVSGQVVGIEIIPT